MATVTKSATPAVVALVLGVILLGACFEVLLKPSCLYQFVQSCPRMSDYLLSLGLGSPGVALIATGLLLLRSARIV